MQGKPWNLVKEWVIADGVCPSISLERRRTGFLHARVGPLVCLWKDGEGQLAACKIAWLQWRPLQKMSRGGCCKPAHLYWARDDLHVAEAGELCTTMTHEQGVVYRHMHVAMQLWTDSIDECVQPQAMTMGLSVETW